MINKEYVLNKLAQLKEPDYFNLTQVSKQEFDKLHTQKLSNVGLFQGNGTYNVVRSNLDWTKGAWSPENDGKGAKIDLNSVGSMSGYNADYAKIFPDYNRALIGWNADHGRSRASGDGRAIVGNSNPFNIIK